MKPRDEQGMSYVEVLIALFLISVCLLPALDALRTGLLGSEVHETLATEQFQLSAKLEEVLARPFDELEAEAVAVASPSVATSYSDASGAQSRRLVYLSAYDIDDADADSDPFSGTEAEILWVRVEIEQTARSLETLTAP